MVVVGLLLRIISKMMSNNYNKFHNPQLKFSSFYNFFRFVTLMFENSTAGTHELRTKSGPIPPKALDFGLTKQKC